MDWKPKVLPSTHLNQAGACAAKEHIPCSQPFTSLQKVDKSENVCIFHVPVKRLETMQKDANPDKSVLVISIGHVKSLEKLFGEKCTHLGHVLK